MLYRKIIVVDQQLFKNSSAFCGTWNFITVYTKARHLCQSWGTSIHFPSSNPITLRSVLILFTNLIVVLPNCVFPLLFPYQEPARVSLSPQMCPVNPQTLLSPLIFLVIHVVSHWLSSIPTIFFFLSLFLPVFNVQWLLFNWHYILQWLLFNWHYILQWLLFDWHYILQWLLFNWHYILQWLLFNWHYILQWLLFNWHYILQWFTQNDNCIKSLLFRLWFETKTKLGQNLTQKSCITVFLLFVLSHDIRLIFSFYLRTNSTVIPSALRQTVNQSIRTSQFSNKKINYSEVSFLYM